jgi:hypothetical protein
MHEQTHAVRQSDEVYSYSVTDCQPIVSLEHAF